MAQQKVKPNQQLAVANASGNSGVLTGSLPMGGELTVATLASFYVPVASKVLINAHSEVLLTTNQEFYMTLYDNGVALVTVSNNSQGSDFIRFKNLTTVPTLAAGNHVLTLAVRAFNGAAGTYNSPAYGNTLSYMVAGVA